MFQWHRLASQHVSTDPCSQGARWPNAEQTPIWYCCTQLAASAACCDYWLHVPLVTAVSLMQHNFDVAHAQFANFWPKLDGDPNPNRLTLTLPQTLTLKLMLAESCSTFCKLHRLTNCMQQHHQLFLGPKANHWRGTSLYWTSHRASGHLLSHSHRDAKDMECHGCRVCAGDYCRHWRLGRNNILVSAPVHSSSAGKCSLHSKHHDDQMSHHYSHYIYSPSALLWWANDNDDSNNNNGSVSGSGTVWETFLWS